MTELPPAPARLPATVVDAHTHLDACGASDQAEVRAVMDRAAAVGVAAVVTVADDMDSARWVVSASSWDERVFAAVALHPTRTAIMTDADRAELERLARQPRVVAVGETGLDYYWTQRDPRCAPPEAQRDAYRWHIDLAKRVGKPLMIHDRDAHSDVLAVLDSLYQEAPASPVILVGFSLGAYICVSLGLAFRLVFSRRSLACRWGAIKAGGPSLRLRDRPADREA